MNRLDKIEDIIYQCTKLYEYEQKQVISILIALTLNDRTNVEAKEIYNSVIKKLSN